MGVNDFVFGTDKGIHFYELRHTFSNTLFEQNTNPRVVQSLMGHRKIETTMIYNTVQDNKYLEGAVGVFDSRYETAAEAVEETEERKKYYKPPKNTNEELATTTTKKQSATVDTTSKTDDLAQKVAAFMAENGIDDLEEFLSGIKKKQKIYRWTKREVTYL